MNALLIFIPPLPADIYIYRAHMSSLAKKLSPQIESILSRSDLTTVSAKAVRKELVKRGADEQQVKDARKEIDEVISDIYDRLTSNPAPVASSSRAKPPRQRSETPTIPASSQPVPLVDVKPSIKRERDTVKTERLIQNVKEETDEEMAARLQREFDGLNSGRASRSTGPSAKPKAKKRKTPVKRKSRATLGSGSDGEGGEDEGGEKKKRRGGGGGAFNKELILSDALSNLIGETRLSRPQTVKKIWEYIKGRDLQDPADKRFILCDDTMKTVFHTDKLHMFTMNKLLVPHFMDPDEIVNGHGDQDEKKPIKAPKVERDDQGGSSRVKMDVFDEEEDGAESGYESSDYHR